VYKIVTFFDDPTCLDIISETTEDLSQISTYKMTVNGSRVLRGAIVVVQYTFGNVRGDNGGHVCDMPYNTCSCERAWKYLICLKNIETK